MGTIVCKHICELAEAALADESIVAVAWSKNDRRLPRIKNAHSVSSPDFHWKECGMTKRCATELSTNQSSFNILLKHPADLDVCVN